MIELKKDSIGTIKIELNDCGIVAWMLERHTKAGKLSEQVTISCLSIYL